MTDVSAGHHIWVYLSKITCVLLLIDSPTVWKVQTFLFFFFFCIRVKVLIAFSVPAINNAVTFISWLQRSHPGYSQGVNMTDT